MTRETERRKAQLLEAVRRAYVDAVDRAITARVREMDAARAAAFPATAPRLPTVRTS